MRHYLSLERHFIMSVLLRLCFGLFLLAPALVHAATLENPANGSFYSGIGVISGWKCTANGPLTVRFNGGDAIPLAYLNERGDNAGVCGDTNNGFVAIMNWALLGDGTHTAVAYDNGIEFARSTFEVATTGEPYVTGAEGECRVPNFPAPGETMPFAWNEATQHLEMVGDDGSGSGTDDHGNTAREATSVSIPSSIQGRIEPATDEDWFRLQVSSAGFLRLYPVGSGTWVELYQGEEVRDIVSWSENRNAAVRLHRNGRDNAGNYFTHYRVEPDVYYAVVRIGGTATGPYQFEICWNQFETHACNFARTAASPAKAARVTAMAAAGQGVLENPRNGSFYSGIGVISGWKCDANGPLTVRFNDGDAIPLAYLNERGDTASVCGDTNNGFVAIMNWALLGDGQHTAVAYDNGAEFARSTFTVATTGESFVTGAEGECRVPDFPAPGETVPFVWNEATQHLEMVGVNDGGSSGEGDGGGVCDRTPQVRDAIMGILRRRGAQVSCEDITAEHLARIDTPHVWLRKSNLTTLKNGDFAGLSNLDTLVLDYNPLTSLPLGVFSDLSNLDMLFLDSNQLTSLSPGLFRGLSNLRQLTLDNNPLTSLPPGVFSDLSNLAVLWLNNNPLTSLPPGVFRGLSNLTALTLNNNQLTSLPPGVFRGLSNLRHLGLNNNRLTSLPPGLFRGLSNLTVLHLGNNQLTSLPPGVFADLPDTAKIYLEGNPGYPFPNDGRGGGGGGGGGTVDCNNAWTGSQGDFQIVAHCLAACAAAQAGDVQGRDANCSILRTYERHFPGTVLRYCPVCQ